jgi:hypothetical protein
MKKAIYIVALFISLQTNAQKWDIGVSAGAANYWGDLAPSIAFNETKPAAAVFARYNISTSFAWVNQISAFQLSGDDKNFTYNKMRNLNFSTNVTEYASYFEFNFIKFGPFKRDAKFTGFTYLGFAGFSFNPQTKLNGETYNLVDLQTEGVSYSKFSYAIPFGIGVKWLYSHNKSIEASIGFRRTYTDYLDDVSGKYADPAIKTGIGGLLADRSWEVAGEPQFKKGFQRGDPGYNDWYMQAMITFSIRLPSKIKCAKF